MQITMVKKRLANGEPCEKCAQTEEMLKRRGLWERIDDVVWAIEGEPESPGMRLGAKHGVEVAPFFVITDDAGAESVMTSPLKMIREYFAHASGAGSDPAPRSQSGRAVEPAATEDVSVAQTLERLADASPQEILRWGLERYGESCRIAFSGAEDIVLIEMATRLRLPFSVFTIDTGRLHSETYAFIDEVRRRFGVEIEIHMPESESVTDLVQRRGQNGFYRDGHQECCSIRKVAPLRRALAGASAWVTGRRRDQSPATRARLPVIQQDAAVGDDGPRLIKLNPLAAWSHDQVWQYIRENALPTNPLHERGFVSIGCEPCTRAVGPDQHERDGRWWWEKAEDRECGLHVGGAGI